MLKSKIVKVESFLLSCFLGVWPQLWVEDPQRLWQFCLDSVTILAVSSEGEGRRNSWYCPCL